MTDVASEMISARRGALHVIFAHQRVRHAARSARSVAGQRRHEDAVRKLKVADRDRVEECWHVWILS